MNRVEVGHFLDRGDVNGSIEIASKLNYVLPGMIRLSPRSTRCSS